MRRTWAGAVLGTMLFAAGCATNPVTGRTELALISESQEIAMGQQAAEEVEASIGVVDDAELNAYVQRVGETLARASERPHLPWRFRVVDDPTPNAFALPGGFIYVTRGMLSLMENEAELAGVLGHEIGHVTARHSVQMISRQQLAQIGLIAGMILVPEIARFGDLAGTGLQLLFLSYGRDAERQADDLGFKYSLQQNYDVREMPDIFQSLARSSELAGQSPLPSWLSTHPLPQERIERISAMLTEVTPADRRLETAAYMQRVDGLVYGQNPRQGFFQGSTFLHPELRFRLDFPQGFQLANLPSAVQAISERQDAVVQFTFAEGSAAQAASAFRQQQGVRTGQARSEWINNIPAVIMPFEAQTEGGALAGYAAYIEDGQRTYQLLAYSAAQNIRAYENAFLATINSYQRVSDPAVLNRQPAKISAVRLPSAMTFNEFMRRYPSSIDAQELALINQITNLSAQIPAGTWLKRVQ